MMDNDTLFALALALSKKGGGGGSSSLEGLNDVSITSPQGGECLKYNALTQKWENGDDVGAVIDDSTTSATKVWSSSKTNTELGKKQDSFIIVSGTLTAGETSITLSSEAITADSNIIILTSPEVLHDSISATTGSVTITFDAQANDIGVKAVIF